MKYLKSFSKFEGLEISDTDLPDEKKGKEKINDIEQNIKDYKQKKPQIEQLYASTKNPVEIEEKLKKLMPESEEPNPFLTDFLRICRLQKQIEDGRKSSTEDKMKVDDYQQNQKLSTDKEEIAKIGDKISQIEDRSSTYEQQIAKKSQELKKLMSEHRDKMSKIEKEIKDSSKLFSADKK